MPVSKPSIPAKAAKPAPVPKKNSVDYIASKLSYDTAIPVSIFDDRSEFIERCKPYDIIDGLNPLDDCREDVEYSNAGADVVTSITSAQPVVKTEGVSAVSSLCSNRKRSRSPLSGASKAPSMKNESDNENSSSHFRPTFTRPSRDGWAAEQLREGRPYQLLRSHDMVTRVRYLLDDCDYDWCAAQNLPPEVVQRGITYLEWAYVSSLLTAATPHVDDPLAADEVPALTSSSGGGDIAGSTAANSGFAQENGVVSALGSGCLSNGVCNGSCGEVTEIKGVSSPTTNAIARLCQSRRRSERGKHATANASAFTCALCSKSVHLLSQHTVKLDNAGEGGDALCHITERRRSRDAGGEQGRGGRAKCATAANPMSGNASVSSSTTNTLANSVGSRAHSAVSAETPTTGTTYAGHSSLSALPFYDLQHQGLRCCECGVVAHLRCWFLTGPPRLPEAWTCDGCTNYAQHRKRSAHVCCMCGRMGGVLLPYVSSTAALRDDGEGANNDPQSPTQTHGHVGFSTTPVAQSDMVCHAVCALTMPELAIQPKSTVLRRNGLVDMEERPYVYAVRRVGKQKYAIHCVFCEHGGTGRCVQCHHPHCFEAMHASCAAEAHTVDCHPDLASSPPGFATSGGGMSTHGATADAISGPFFPGDYSVNGGGVTNVGNSAVCWLSCSTYCKKHYGYSVSNSVGSAALSEKAEAEALVLDLTGLLTGGDGVTSPVVKKRGRGRPPVALVQQRQAERLLIQKLHAYWLERREQRRRASSQLVSEINSRLRPVVEATLRPEIVKVSTDKVRLSHFLSLVAEWQWQLVAIVEGELPLPDEEYDDVQKYRKVAHTRRSGNTRSLYDRMSVAATQLDLMCRITAAMKQECRLRRTSAELEVESLLKLCEWK